MKPADLIDLGLDADIARLLEPMCPKLLHVQEKAVKAGLLDGDSMVVSAPTGSGKTFVALLAALRAIRKRGRALYAVPHKAIADEKHLEWSAQFAACSLRVAVSTQDRSEFDEAILDGRYDLAIATYEKIAALGIRRPGFFDSVAMVAVDELQMIGDSERGGGLDLLLSRFLASPTPPQIVGLAASLVDPAPLAKWLGAKLVTEKKRPVELRKGVLRDGAFRYREHNSRRQGEEKLFTHAASGRDLDEAARELMLAAAEHFAVRMKQGVLAVLPTKRECESMAAEFAERAKLPMSEAAIAALRDVEDSQMRDGMRRALESSAAPHHGDLPAEYRELVERHVRDGNIRVVFATSTLSMGVNLPFDNVLLFPKKWVNAPSGWVPQDLTPLEADNTGGRAGRLGKTRGAFGRAILVEPSAFHEQSLWQKYVEVEPEKVPPRLQESPLEEVVLSALAMAGGASEAEVVRFLKGTLSGSVVWRDDASLPARVRDAVKSLTEQGMATIEENRVVLTRLGNIAAASGIRPRTITDLAQWCRDRAAFEIIPLLVAVGLTPDGRDVAFPMTRAEVAQDVYPAHLRGALPLRSLEDPAMKAAVGSARSWDTALVVKKALALADWIEEKPLRDIEATFHAGGGAIQRLGTETAWLVDALRAVAQACDWPRERIAELEKLAGRLRVGIREELLPLVRLGLGRTKLRRLFKSGATSPEAAHQLSPQLASSGRTPQERGLRMTAADGRPRLHCGTWSKVLRGRQAEVILLLMLAPEHREGGWITLKDVDDNADTARRTLSRVKEDLTEETGIHEEKFYENDHNRGYRLWLGGASFSVDVAELRRQCPELVTEVEEILKPRRGGAAGQ